MFVIVSYDVPDDRRRLKMAKLLLDFGGVRVQRSVFELYIELRAFDRLHGRLVRLHVAEEDSIRFYQLCESCRPKLQYLGQAHPIDEPGLLII